MSNKPRYTVRKMTSGWNGVSKFYVYDLQQKERVTVHAHLMREAAQADADRLNILDMCVPGTEDPRPFDVRYEEARQRYLKRRDMA
jgi:hypothetical protein